jgi:hypothetical protein
VAHARTDLSQYAATYYFRDADPDTALAGLLPGSALRSHDEKRPGGSTAARAGSRLT